MASFAVLQPAKPDDHRHLHHGHTERATSEDLIDLDMPSLALSEAQKLRQENLIDLDDASLPPRPPPHPRSQASTVIPSTSNEPRRMFNDRVQTNGVHNDSSAMEGIEQQPVAEEYKLQGEDLIDVHADRKSAMLSQEAKDREMSLLDVDITPCTSDGIEMSMHAPQDIPIGPRPTKSSLPNASSTLPPRPPRTILQPKGPSHHLRRIDPLAHRRFLAEQEYQADLRRAYAKYSCRIYADWDGMGDRRRGPRGYGGSFPRRGSGGGGMKRRNEDEDDYDRRDYRERRLPPSIRFREAVVAIADDPERLPVEDVAQLARMIEEHYQDQRFIDSIKQILPHLAVEQPLKIPHVAAIILHLHEKKPDAAALVVEAASSRAQTALNAGDWRMLKLLLRFFALTHEIYDGTGVFTVLDELFNRAVDLQAASSEDAIGIELVKIIMLTIPYLVASRGSDIEAQVGELLEKTALVADAELDAEKTVNPYVRTSAGEVVMPKLITLLQRQLQHEAECGWPLAFLPKLYTKPETNGSNDESASAAPAKLSFPALAVPATINPGPRPIFLEVYFSLYADQDVETVPRTSELAALLIRDVLVDTLNILDFNRKACTRLLTDVDQYFAPGTFAKRMTPYDKIKDAKQGESTWKPEDMGVDAVFALLMQLPASEHKPVYYHSLITELCSISPQAFAPCLGRAIRFLYRSVESLDLELVARYTDWFSHHLSNYDFRWKWDEWAGDVELPETHPKQAFIRDVLSKEIRLSFAKRIRDGLPPEYQRLIPAAMDNDIPHYKYNDKTTPFATEALSILAHLRKKSPDSEIAPDINAIINQAESDTTESNTTLLAVDAYVSSLCYIGSKSLSHVLTYIERNQNRLRSFSRDASSATAAEAARVQIIESVVSYWRDTQTGVALNIVDKLLNYGIISPGSAIVWALGSGGEEEGGAARRANPRDLLPEGWIYEMVSSTLAKVSNVVRQIVARRMQVGLPPSQATSLDEALEKESGEMVILFGAVEDALASVSQGSDDVMIEEGVGDDEYRDSGESEMQLLRLWGRKWARVFARKRHVEQAFVREAMGRFPEPGVEPEDVPLPEDVEGENGIEVEMKDGEEAKEEVKENAMVKGGSDTAVAVNGDAVVDGAGEKQEENLIDI